MYLIINGNKHTCSKRIVGKNEIRFMTVSPAVDLDKLSGTIQMFREDGFLLCEDSTENYERKTMTGTLLVLTNKPVPTPEEHTMKPEHRLSVLETENAALKEQLQALKELIMAVQTQN